MIILPDRNIARAKYLTPLHYKQWRPPIWWEGRETGNVLGIYFIVQAFRSNGEMVWKGWFEDREDADEFMYSHYREHSSGSLHPAIAAEDAVVGGRD